MTQNNKGAALLDLARLLGGKKRTKTLQQAMACCDVVLTLYTREDTPIDWALAKNNKGVALRELASLREGADQRERYVRRLPVMTMPSWSDDVT